MQYRHIWLVIVGLGMVIAVLLTILLIVPAKAPSVTDIGLKQDPTLFDIGIDDMLVITAPEPDTFVSSPLIVRGRARGSWYFEASFPLKIYDSLGQELGAMPAQVQSEWMTNDFVNFSALLEFRPSTTATGTLVFEKDNPSGLPQNDLKFELPVRFN